MFTKTTIKFRLSFVLGILVMLMISIGLLGLYGLNETNNAVKRIYDDRLVTSQQLGKILDTWYQIRKLTEDSVDMSEIENARRNLNTANTLVRQNENIWAEYLKTQLTPEEAVLSKTKGNQHTQYVESFNRSLQLAASGNFVDAKQNFLNDTIPKFDALRNTVFALLDLQGTVAEEELAASQNNFNTLLIVLVSAMIMSMILAIIFGITLLKSIVGPLDDAIAIAHKVAQGDLTSNIVVSDTKTETGQLLQTLKAMNDNLVNLVGQVRISTDQISTASSEIASGNSDLSQRTEEQASSLEETASSMEELTSTVKQNADNAS